MTRVSSTPTPITDFILGQDKIDLSFLKVSDLASLTPFMTQVGEDTVISLGYDGDNETIVLKNVNKDALTAANFVFYTAAVAVNATGTGFSDVLFGGSIADTLVGGDGTDTLVGGAGNDRLTGGDGTDTLWGGLGNDIFAYSGREFDADTIADFILGQDKIDLSFLKVSDLASLTPFMTQVGEDTVISLGYDGDDETIVLKNVNKDALTASDFVFYTSAIAVNATGTGFSDVLFGGSIADTLAGGDGTDTLVGGAGDDRLTGGDGTDTLWGGLGSDTFAYSGREFDADTIADFILGQDKIDLSFLKVSDLASLKPFMTQVGNDTVISLGYDGDDETIILKNVNKDALTAANFVFYTAAVAVNATGTGFSDVLFGGSIADTLVGGDGTDTLVGGAGNDRLTGGDGTDTLWGGLGSDIFAYSGREFDADTIADFILGQDKIDLSFLKVSDLASLTPFMTQVGNDTVISLGYDGDDETIILKNINKNALTAGDFVFYTSAIAVNATGTGFSDVLFGGVVADILSGGSGSDTLVGGAGDDLFRGGTGGDRFFGGTGTDTVSYFGTAAAVTVNLLTGTATGGEAQGDTFNGVENVTGTGFNDTLIGNAGANRLQGQDGNDSLQGGDGNDVLIGGTGADRLDGGAGVDTVSYFGTAGAVTVDLGTGKGTGGEAQYDTLIGIENVNGGQGNDTLAGNAGANVLAGYEGNDVLRGGGGADRLDGGTGTDTVSYFTSGTGIGINLASGTGSGGDAQGDVLVSIENVSGSQGNDVLTGSAGANTLQGWDGSDVLTGAGGKDMLTGGAGADRFVYGTITDSVVGTNADRITDFSRAQGDKIDLSAIDANWGVAGNQAFTFIGTGLFTHQAGQLRFAIFEGQTIIAGDVNGDGTSDFHVVLTNGVSLQTSDFVL